MLTFGGETRLKTGAHRIIVHRSEFFIMQVYEQQWEIKAQLKFLRQRLRLP